MIRTVNGKERRGERVKGNRQGKRNEKKGKRATPMYTSKLNRECLKDDEYLSTSNGIGHGSITTLRTFLLSMQHKHI